jgi:hypothetical protein
MFFKYLFSLFWTSTKTLLLVEASILFLGYLSVSFEFIEQSIEVSAERNRMHLRIAVETFHQILIIFIQSSSALILKQEMKFYVFLQIKRFAKTFLGCVLHHEMQHFY